MSKHFKETFPSQEFGHSNYCGETSMISQDFQYKENNLYLQKYNFLFNLDHYE